MKTIGQNIAFYRKEKGLTQERLAEICEVTPQAVSKWENGISCPDVTLLKRLARTFGISVDELLDDGEGAVTKLATGNGAKGKLLKLRAVDKEDKVSINLPVALIKLLLENEELKNSIHIGKKDLLNSVDFEEVMELVSLGVIGKILEVQSENGDLVEVWVE